MDRQKYTTETKTVDIQGKTFTVTNLTPILSPEERGKQKQEIEQRLYVVYVKYENNGSKAE